MTKTINPTDDTSHTNSRQQNQHNQARPLHPNCDIHCTQRTHHITHHAHQHPPPYVRDTTKQKAQPKQIKLQHPLSEKLRHDSHYKDLKTSRPQAGDKIRTSHNGKPTPDINQERQTKTTANTATHQNHRPLTPAVPLPLAAPLPHTTTSHWGSRTFN
jgi:hypothetical protein